MTQDGTTSGGTARGPFPTVHNINIYFNAELRSSTGGNISSNELRSDCMVRKSKKGIVGKVTTPGTGFGIPGPGLDLVRQDLKSSKEIEAATREAREKEGLE